jgi:hypothetical protein
MRGSDHQARCPSHEDANPSLSVSVGDEGRVLVKCHAGCSTEAVVRALGLHMRDLGPESSSSGAARRSKQEVATFDYANEEGRVLYQTVRYSPKGFAQRRPDGNGGWIYNLKGVRRVPYRLPELLAAMTKNKVIVIVEGEKCAEAVRQLGYEATTNPMGAGKWIPEWASTFDGARVAILPDNDEPGRQHATFVASSLIDVAATVKVVELPGLAPHGDVVDWQMAGGTREALWALLRDAPQWTRSPGTPHPTDGSDPGAPWPVLVCVADVAPETVRWLWPGRIPFGKVTVLDGDPDLGKSSITLDVAARVSTGSPMPDGHQLEGKGSVILLSAEDGIADTIRPRLDAHGADQQRVEVLTAVAQADVPERPWSLPGDLPILRNAIERVGASLVVIDPLMAFLAGEVNSNRDQDVRRALHPLSELANPPGVAVVDVRHLNKSGGANAVYRGGGSIGIIGAARSALMVMPDPDDETECRRVLAVSKCNLAPRAPSLAYHVETSEEHDCGRVVWEGQSRHTAVTLLSGPPNDEERSVRAEASDWLRALLTPDRVRADEVKRLWRATGWGSESTLTRARRDIKVVSRREGFGPGAVYWWELPDHAGQPPVTSMVVSNRDEHDDVADEQGFPETLGLNGHHARQHSDIDEHDDHDRRSLEAQSESASRPDEGWEEPW